MILNSFSVKLGRDYISEHCFSYNKFEKDKKVIKKIILLKVQDGTKVRCPHCAVA